MISPAAAWPFRALGKVLVAGLVLSIGLAFASPAHAAERPSTPEQIADYFAEGLIPRLIDLFGSGDGVTSGIDFDASTEVGAISRVLEWTPDFLAGKDAEIPTQLTNIWVAPVNLRGSVLGLAIVWINPATDQPELADFGSSDLAIALSRAPAKSLLVHQLDAPEWFAIDGEVLTPLVAAAGESLEVTSPAEYQRTIAAVAPAEPSGPADGILIASLFLGLVLVGLALFVIFPILRRSPNEIEQDLEPAPEPLAKSENAAASTSVAKPKPQPKPQSKSKPQPKPQPKQTRPSAQDATTSSADLAVDADTP